MKKNIFPVLVYLLTFIVTAVNLCYSVNGSVFSDISNLPQGEYVETTVSPNGIGKILTYKVENSVGKAIRCEFENSGNSRNVFWQTGVDNVEVNWINPRVVIINGVELDVVGGGFYDCRRGVSLFQEGSIEGGKTDINETTANE